MGSKAEEDITRTWPIQSDARSNRARISKTLLSMAAFDAIVGAPIDVFEVIVETS
ncbi:hypothetical protein PY650_35940 [Rhizobium calliandrae]|uniref:Uncharacterized protein n=1 Tax=Rhizobium calliandrae TaxID=1312182 RepID=A0ABT7KQE3_9HYPH|nr:hypothetical protein [Rhizobium calliandrae]MDL2410834.1 hypothetical protein [Rhizobium calliandrae]